MKISEDENEIELPNGINLLSEKVDDDTSDWCGPCYFFSNGVCGLIPCTSIERKDNTSVIFKELYK